MDHSQIYHDQDERDYWNKDNVLKSTGASMDVETVLPNVRFFEAACAKHGAPEDAKILALGCGPGKVVKGLRQVLDHPKWNITAVDGSQGMIDIAVINNKDILPEAEGKDLCEVEFRCLNALDMEYHEEFDILWTATVLQHNSFKNKDVFLPKMYKALKPGGLYICFEGTKIEKKWALPTEKYPEGEMQHHGERGPFTYDWHDCRGSLGAPGWWVKYIGMHGFELQEYGNPKRNCYVFRKINNPGSFPE